MAHEDQGLRGRNSGGQVISCPCNTRASSVVIGHWVEQVAPDYGPLIVSLEDEGLVRFDVKEVSGVPISIPAYIGTATSIGVNS